LRGKAKDRGEEKREGKTEVRKEGKITGRR
jgi:hypothetical protein